MREISFSNHVGSDFDGFLKDSEQNQLVDTTLSSLPADEIFCVGSDADMLQSFDKRRRGNNVCQDPKIKPESGAQGSKQPFDPFNFERFLNAPHQIGTFFKASEELCPPRIFRSSTIPVCAYPGAVIKPYFPYPYSDVLNIYPCTWVYNLDPRRWVSYY